MDGQTEMSINGKAGAKRVNVVADFSELAHDVIELSELQAKLLALDVKATTRRMRAAIAFAIVGACILLGSVPVVLMIAAEALVEFAAWSRTASTALAAAIGLLLSAIVLAIAWQRLKTMLTAFDRSREELSRNLLWLKTSLQRNSSATTHDRMAGATSNDQ
jgi:hypothetical protein